MDKVGKVQVTSDYPQSVQMTSKNKAKRRENSQTYSATSCNAKCFYGCFLLSLCQLAAVVVAYGGRDDVGLLLQSTCSHKHGESS